ncbi:LysR family transcriptional regulator [Variovorax saccharolyticus]|uniref:LysR family transcriptional regulator n=1 Tax=Variovorax saccharolyticus TaxID=3053516 RepID=UPI002576297B|nr:LysR family transcriptional regulator [Variovorax sp. J31P216]MDM0027440.1 LysR family transcriptional regulator [Variovorax sp. J31P216]
MPPSPVPSAVAASSDRIELMKTFVQIVEAGSLSAAAAQMRTTQPTVSRRLQALERLLGVRLLRRSTHAMKLTEDGERCVERARELIESWQAFESDLRGDDEEPEGMLRVVAPHAFGQQLLVGPLAAYIRRHPRVSVEWLLHDRRPDFIAEGVDCAIQVGEVNDLGVVAIKLSEVPRIVVAAPSVLEGLPAPTHARELAALPWLALRTFYRTEILLSHARSGESCRVALRPRLSTDSLYALRSAAVMGMGVCVGSTWLLAEELAQGRLIQLAPEWQAAALPVYLTYPQARLQPPKLKRFIEAMRFEWPT